MEEKTVLCDIKGCGSAKDSQRRQVPIILLTDQSEGEKQDPNLGSGYLDLCRECYKKILSGQIPMAAKENGQFTYYFKGGK